MSNDLTDAREKRIKLREARCKQLPDQINRILSLWSDLTVYPWTNDKAQQMLQLSHGLIATSDSVGALVLSQVAKDLDVHLQKIIANNTPPTTHQRKDIVKLVRVLQQASKNFGLTDSGVTATDADSHMRDTTQQEGLLVYIVENDEMFAQVLATELQHAGYETQIFIDIQTFKHAYVDLIKPAAIVMAMVFPESEDAGAQVVDDLRREHASMVPVVFISERRDIEARLLALRSGAAHYLIKPCNVERLVRLLDEATLRSPLNPYRVLLVDDDRCLAEFHSAILEEAGMTTYVLSDPLLTLEAIKTFHPDVIILDIYMPGCSGIELAMILNDDACFVEMPILYLSLETSHKNQLAALTVGGDDFLIKPIEPQDFVRVVKLRARKGRHIRELHDDLRHALNAFQCDE